MHTLAVGELYNPNRLGWPEAVNYNFRGGQHELLLILEGLTPAEIESYRTGRMRLGFTSRFGLIVFLWRPEGQPWSDTPFSWWRVAEHERVAPPVEHTPETRALLQIILVSAEDGIVRVLRVVSLCPRLTRLLHAAIAEQAATPMPNVLYQATVNKLYMTYPTTPQLVQDATVTCNAGD